MQNRTCLPSESYIRTALHRNVPNAFLTRTTTLHLGRGHWSSIRNVPSQFGNVPSYDFLKKKDVIDADNGSACEKDVVAKGASNSNSRSTTSNTSSGNNNIMAIDDNSNINGNVSSSSSNSSSSGGVSGIITAVTEARARGRGRPPKNSPKATATSTTQGSTPNGMDYTGSGGVKGDSRTPKGNNTASILSARAVQSLSSPQAAHTPLPPSISKVTAKSERKREREREEMLLEREVHLPHMKRKWGSPKTPS